jgi:hypothetical protein
LNDEEVRQSLEQILENHTFFAEALKSWLNDFGWDGISILTKLSIGC